MDDLDALEALLAKATPGRHTTGEAEHDAIPYVGIGYTDEVYALDGADPHEAVAEFARPEDAALYAATRNALPALLAELRRLRRVEAENAFLREWLRGELTLADVDIDAALRAALEPA